MDAGPLLRCSSIAAAIRGGAYPRRQFTDDPVQPVPARYDRRVFRIDGIDGESIVVDGNWVEKLRAGSSRGRNPADQYSGTKVEEFTRRKKIFGGEKEHLLQVIVSVGTFYSLKVPAERRAEVDALIAELEKARDRATS